MRNSAQDWPLTTIFGTGSPFPAELPVPALSPEQKLKALLGTMGKLAGFFVSVFAVGLLLVSAYVALRVSEQLRSWPRANAEVVGSGIYEKEVRHVGEHGGPTRSTDYGYQWMVSFAIGSRTYQTPIDIGYQKGDRADMLEWLGRYPDGTHITVAYDPTNPAHARLAEDFRSSYAPVLSTLGFCAWLLGGGIAMILISRRLQAPQPSCG